MQTLEKAVPRLEKEARTNKDRKARAGGGGGAQAVLDTGKTLFSAGTGDVAAARAEPDDHQAVLVRVQRRRVGAHR